jgi:hypothetical protein
MKISEYSASQKRESEQLAKELEAHMATWPQVKTKFDEIDQQCIALAARFSAARMAASPTVLELEAELKKCRWKRDDGKTRFTIRRDELRREIEAFTREPIHKFHQECLDRVQGLSKLYKYERLEPSHNFDGRRVRYGVKISHNTAALSRMKDRIFAAIKEVNDMLHSPLADVEKRISEFCREFENFEYDSMVVEEVSEQQAADMQPGREEPASGNRGIKQPDGHIHIFKDDTKIAPRLKSLENKISFLEKTI